MANGALGRRGDYVRGFVTVE